MIILQKEVPILKAIACAALILLALCTGCGGNIRKTQPEREELVWYLPTAGQYKAAEEVSTAVNKKISEKYPNICIKFKFTNIYEYPEKLSVYLSAGEQADIVWVNDSVLPFLNYPSESIYKFLDAPIKTMAPHISARLALDNKELYKIYDKNYYIPVINHSSGLIPFLKIPKELEAFIDKNALISAVNGGEEASVEIFEIINKYLDSVKSAGKLKDGIEFASVSKIFPLIGYETFISTDELIGCRIGDSTHTAVDMLNTPSSLLSYKTYEEWFAKGYFKENTPIIYKSDFISDYDYIMSGTWGYETENGFSMVMDKNTSGYVYIALDRKYHPTKLFTESAVIIPTASKHAESALKVLDLFYSDAEFYNLLSFGIEGTHYTRDKNGCAKLLSDEYRCFENIVPNPDGALTSVCAENVYRADFEPCGDPIGMYIPSSSTDFRRMLFDYTEKYSVPVYALKTNAGVPSEAGKLLAVYNGSVTVD